MIVYGKPPDNQMAFELPGINDKGYERMKEAQEFSIRHRGLWFKYLDIVENDMTDWPDGKASPNDCFTLFKKKHRRELKDAGCVLRDNMAAYFARVAVNENPEKFQFRLAKSAGDAFSGVKL